MSKYRLLGEYLSNQTSASIPMKFGEIEKILGHKLPPSKLQRAWWSNNASNNVMTNQWLKAGYETTSVDISGEKLVFRRAKAPLSNDGSDSSERKRHPIFGFMKGTISVMPGVDLTAPADPDWGKVYDDEQ